MNAIRWEMIREGSFDFPKSIVLPLADYKATGFFDWQPISVDTELINKMNREGVIVHYTWLLHERKEFMAKLFGHWNNVTYYNVPPPLLSPINIAGTRSEIFQQIIRAANIAKLCGRTFMFPFLINETLPDLTWRMVPPHRTGDVDDVMRIGPWVEGTFLHNRRNYNLTELSETTVLGPRDLIDNYASQPVIDTCFSSNVELFKVDFGSLERQHASV